jgi:hypothetical protein
MSFPHHRLAALTALTAYLVVNVGAGALHHHHGAAVRPGKATACGTGLLLQAAGQAGDEDDEDTCALCSVLHLAQAAPARLHVEVVIVLAGEAVPAAAISQAPLFATPSRARSPPAV